MLRQDVMCDLHLFIREVAPHLFRRDPNDSAPFNFPTQQPLPNLTSSTPFESSSTRLLTHIPHPQWLPRKRPPRSPRRLLPPPLMRPTKVCSTPIFFLHHAVASLWRWVYLGRVPLLTYSARHDQGSYPCCESTSPGAFDLTALYMLHTTRLPDMPTTTHPFTP